MRTLAAIVASSVIYTVTPALELSASLPYAKSPILEEQFHKENSPQRRQASELFHRGTILADEGKYFEAVRSLQESVNLYSASRIKGGDARLSEALLELGAVYYEFYFFHAKALGVELPAILDLSLEKLVESKNEYERSAAKDVKLLYGEKSASFYATLFANLANVHKAKGNLREALTYGYQLLEINPAPENLEEFLRVVSKSSESDMEALYKFLQIFNDSNRIAIMDLVKEFRKKLEEQK